MSRVLISAAVVIAIALALMWFSTRDRGTESMAPAGRDVASATPAGNLPPADDPSLAGAPPAMAPQADPLQPEGEVEVQGQLADAESIQQRMQDEGVLPPPPDIDWQPLLDEIGGPGEDNERVLAMTDKLRGADLEKADLRLIDLHGANAADVNLQEAKLQGADFSGANLAGAKLEGADLTAAVLDGADLRGAHMERATVNVRGRNADLRSADLDGASLQGADLYGADLRDVTMRGASLGAVLRNADLRLADLSRADFLDADLAGANLFGADIRDANNLTCQQLTGARNWETTRRGEALACGGVLPEEAPPSSPPPAEAAN